MSYVVVKFAERREVFIDDQSQGDNIDGDGTPRALLVGEGRHTFRLGGPSDYTPPSQTLNVPDASQINPFPVVFAPVARVPGIPSVRPSRLVAPALGAGAAAGGRSSVFISYSHADRKWLAELRPFLGELEREYPAFEFWDDSKIKPGQEWRPEVRRALGSARAAVLLVSQHFLASEFIRNEELPALLDAATRDGVRLLMLLVSPSRFSNITALSKFQAVHSSDKTLADMKKAERQRVFVRLSEEIAAALRAVPAKGPSG